MIGGEDNDRVFRFAALVKCIQKTADTIIEYRYVSIVPTQIGERLLRVILGYIRTQSNVPVCIPCLILVRRSSVWIVWRTQGEQQEPRVARVGPLANEAARVSSLRDGIVPLPITLRRIVTR